MIIPDYALKAYAFLAEEALFAGFGGPKLFQQLYLLAAEALRDLNINRHNMCTTRAGTTQVRHTVVGTSAGRPARFRSSTPRCTGVRSPGVRPTVRHTRQRGGRTWSLGSAASRALDSRITGTSASDIRLVSRVPVWDFRIRKCLADVDDPRAAGFAAR